MRVLFVSRWFPYPPIHGSKQRVYHLIRALAERHQVSLLSFADHPSIEPGAQEMRALCSDIQVVPWQEYRSRQPRTLLDLFSARPRSIAGTYSAEMAERIRRACASGRCAAVVASQLTSASYHACFAGLPAVFDEIELGVYDDRRRGNPSWLARGRHALTWAKLRRYLASVLRDIDAGTVVSADEEALLRLAVASPPPIAIVPNGTIVPEAVPAASQRARDTLVFAGALTYAANAEGLRWFLATAYPQVRARCPDVRLTVTGETGGIDLSAGGVLQTGHLPDARPIVASAAVSIAPLRWGGGTRLKILEAMALGTPVVATSKAAEGLTAVDGEHVLIADEPRRFAECILELLTNTGLRQRLADNARRLVAERYEWGAIGAQFVRLVEEVVRWRREGAA
jgi:glycosyltransferase involved in cell wall biosynthesis